MDARCRIVMFGGLEVHAGQDTHTRFRTHKAASLLAYLALNLGKAQPREGLLDLLWPEMESDTARLNLNTTLTQLRRQLESGGVPAGSMLLTDKQQVRLNPQAVTTDVADFDHLLAQARRLEEKNGSEAEVSGAPAESGTARQTGAEEAALLQQALNLYRGPLLPGWYEEWVTLEHSRYQIAYLEAARRLIRLWEESGQYTEALALAQKACALDPYDESGWQAQMRLFVRLRKPSLALQAYASLEQLFQRELGVKPGARSQQLAAMIRNDPRSAALLQAEAHRAATEPAAPEPPAPPSPVLTPPAAEETAPPLPILPLQLTRFFGREAECAEVVGLLQTPGTRLVSLLGPGGAGKTRLALEVAAQVAPAFAHRVCFVSLADIPDAGLIASTLAHALRLPVTGRDDPWEQVISRLQGAPTLLILDNLEHLLRDSPTAGKSDHAVLSGCAGLIRLLLERAPLLTCLVTSRQALRLGGEHEYPLPPLALPTEQEIADSAAQRPESLLGCSSVALYVDRARAVRPDFALNTGNASAVAALCRRLEGMPLALEMAAAWVKTIPPQKMLERLSHQLDLLVSRRRDLPPRHQSLRATIEWSYDLLEPSLRPLFARLGVFQGGWTLEAAEAVCGHEALPALLALQEHSLIVAQESEEAATEPRYRMLEPIREFALEKLAESGETAEIVARHIAYFANLALEAQQAYHGPEEKTWQDRLAVEMDNLRAGLERGLTAEPISEAALEMPSRLWWFWIARGYVVEGRRWALLALTHCPADHLSLRTDLLNAAANLAHEQGDFQESQDLLQQAMLTAEQIGEFRSLVTIRNNLAIAAYDLGDIELARTCWQENLALTRQESWDAALGSTLSNLGELAYDEGDYPTAYILLEESALVRKRTGDRRYMARSLGLMGKVAHRQHDLSRAESLLREALIIRRELADQVGVIETLEAMAALAVTQARPEYAARLLAFTDTTRRKLGTPRPPNEAKECEACLEAIRAVLDLSTLETAQHAGAQWTLDQACAPE